MAQNKTGLALLAGGAAAALLCAAAAGGADEPATVTADQFRRLLEQNQALEQKLQKQQALIDSLNERINGIQAGTAPKKGSLTDMDDETPPANKSAGSSFGGANSKIILSGEGAAGFFNTGSQGQYPQGLFRLDEARLFLEGPVYGDVYFFGQLNLATPETQDIEARLGEAYLDWENASKLWGQDRILNVRLGRMYIPFGEEYLTRYAIDNPLISRSLSDLWGVSPGLELYGRAGKFSYVVAVQNGGISDVQDFSNDKSVAGRVGYDPANWLHLSASAMRTGNLNVNGDKMSALWFGNGFFRSLGSTQTTTFHAELFEGDVQIKLPRGHLHAYGGFAHYDDNDPQAYNGRNVYYYAVEGVQDLTRKLYAGFRFSQILANRGFPIVGYGNFYDYFFETLTKDLWRLSLGLGYRWNQNLVLKTEYSFEQGKLLDGDNRDHEDFFGVEAAFAF